MGSREITSIEDAIKHAAGVKNYTHVVVMPDGVIYAENDAEKIQPIINDHDCFVVKGGLKKEEKEIE